jgi:hypothetical protein
MTGMGLLRLPVRRERIGTLPEIMRAAGFSLLRMEKSDASTHYFFTHSKTHTRISFCLIDGPDGHSSFLTMRLSKAFKEVLAILRKADAFESVDSN